MSEQVKAALVIGAGIVVATFLYSWATAYFSPFGTCVRSRQAITEDTLKFAYERIAVTEENIKGLLNDDDSEVNRERISGIRRRQEHYNNLINELNSPQTHQTHVDECSALNSR